MSLMLMQQVLHISAGCPPPTLLPLHKILPLKTPSAACWFPCNGPR